MNKQWRVDCYSGASFLVTAKSASEAELWVGRIYKQSALRVTEVLS